MLTRMIVSRRPRGLDLVALAAVCALQPAWSCAARAAPSTNAPAARPIVIGHSYRLRSRVLGDERVINVRLPEHYSDKRRSFPVLFLLDGGEQEDFVHIAGLAQINAAYGQGQEVIVVGIQGVDRRHDLTPPSAVPSDRKLAPTSGGAAAYRRFLVGELEPRVAARFRTSGRSALIGESLAGLFVLETFLEDPQGFTDYIAVSPSLWWNGGRAAADAGRQLGRSGLSGKRIWIAFDTPAPPAAAAAAERAQQQQLERAFRTSAPAGLSWTIVHSEEGHATIYHPAALQAFRALFGPPAP